MEGSVNMENSERNMNEELSERCSAAKTFVEIFYQELCKDYSDRVKR